MAARTNTENIQDCVHQLAVLTERVDVARRENEQLKEDLKRVRVDYHELDKRLAILNDRLERHEKTVEQRSLRGWQVWLLVIAAGLTILASLATAALIALANLSPRLAVLSWPRFR